MIRKRWIGASIAVHLIIFAALLAAPLLRVRGPRPAQPVVPPLVRLVDLPRPASQAPQPRRESPIAYPHAAAAPTPRPPIPTPRPTPTVPPKVLAEYRKLNPGLRQVDDAKARMMVERLKRLGLSAASASAITRDVDAAVEAGRDRFYRPTTPGGGSTESILADASGSASSSPFIPPLTWVSTPSPIEEFLGRILPVDRGYDADLTTDPETGLPELRLAVRKEVNYLTGEARLFVERWSPSLPVVDVTVIKPGGEHERTFKMPLPPFGNSLDDFKQQMFGLTMLAYQEALAGRTLPTP